MADITLTSVVDGTLANATVVEQNFYNPSVAGTGSLEAINGHLDNANRIAGWDIDRSQIQEGEVSRGKGVGGNINLDYFGDLYIGYLLTEDTYPKRESIKPFYQAIPGASLTFYLPYPVTVLVISFSVYFGGKMDQLTEDGTGVISIANFIGESGRLQLFIDDERAGTASENVSQVLVPAKGLTSSDNMYGSWDRVWGGFRLINSGATLNAGWHTASVRLVTYPTNAQPSPADARPNNQVRVRGRHMNYVYFR